MSKNVQSRISPKKIRSQSRASVRNRKHARNKHPNLKNTEFLLDVTNPSPIKRPRTSTKGNKEKRQKIAHKNG